MKNKVTQLTSEQHFTEVWEERFNKLETTVKNQFITKNKMEIKTKQRNTAFWIVTGLLVLGMLSGGIAQLVRAKPNVEGTIKLGYPIYIMSILGVWKMLGVIVLIIPKFKLVKEWAYAGFFFAMSGAVISHLASGYGFIDFAAPLAFLILTVLSWWLRPDDRKLAYSSIIE